MGGYVRFPGQSYAHRNINPKENGGVTMRIAVTVAALFLSAAALAGETNTQSVAQRYDFNIPKQSLDTALKNLARQTGLQIALFSDTIDGEALVGPVFGTQSAEDALKALLAPRGLSYKV